MSLSASHQTARWTAVVTEEEAFQLVRRTGHATLRWAYFSHAVYQALHTPHQFERLLLLLRRAPEELRHLVHVQPPDTMNNIIYFLSACTSEYLFLDEAESRQIRAVVRSLIKYAVEVGKLTTPPSTHPPNSPNLRPPSPQIYI